MRDSSFRQLYRVPTIYVWSKNKENIILHLNHTTFVPLKKLVYHIKLALIPLVNNHNTLVYYAFDFRYQTDCKIDCNNNVTFSVLSDK